MDKNKNFKYIVVCYAIHGEEIASYDPFDTYEKARDFLVQDSHNTYLEELYNDGAAYLDNYGDSAILSSCAGEYRWTWEIISIPV